MTAVVVTHEIGFARQAGDTLAILDGGQVIERGPCAQVIDDPRHPRTKAFLSQVRRDQHA